MLQINFSSNPNGKLFGDHFGDIRLQDVEKFMVGNKIEILYKNIPAGTALVVCVKDFSYKRITDSMAFINIGKPAAYQASVLRSYYQHKVNFESDPMLQYIVFKWVHREADYQINLLSDWWQHIMAQQPNYLPLKNT